jgi:hypothetical protein
MNTPTQVTLSNSLVINNTTNTQANELTQLPNEVLAAKNIQFSKDAITLDVFVNKHWQTLRLGTASATQNTHKIANANVLLSADGKQLSIIPNSTTLTLNQPAQLQRFLNYVNTGTEIESQPLAVHVILSPSPKLMIEKLNANIAINKDVAQMLAAEQPLKVIISTNKRGAQLNIINRFADSVHTQPLNQAKLAKLLATLLPDAQLQATPKLAILTHPLKAGSFTTPINSTQLSGLPTTPIKVNLTNQADKLLIKTDTSTIRVTLNNSFLKPFNDMLLSQQSTSLNQLSYNKASPLLDANSPIKSWLQNSFSDLKTRIADAIKHFESKPFTTTSKVAFASKNELLPDVISQPLKQINITQNVSPLTSNKNNNGLSTQSNILSKHVNQLPPLVQLTQLIKASVNVWQGATSNNLANAADKTTKQTITKEIPINILNNQAMARESIFNTKNNPAKTSTLVNVLKAPTISTVLKISDVDKTSTPQRPLTMQAKAFVVNTKPDIPTQLAPMKDNANKHNFARYLSSEFKGMENLNSISPSQMLQPLEAKLLSSLLKQPATLVTNDKIVTKPFLSSQINDIAQKASQSAPDLTRLINQAFNRMVSSSNIHPATVERELLATLQPSQLKNDTLQSSFTKGLEQIAVSILAAPIISQAVTPVSFNNQTGLDALLQVLLPAFKTGNTSAKLLEQLQQTQVQALANELIQVKSTLTQVQTSSPNQQPESNPLVQFLLPMKLPPEAAQTEITLGKYKKPGGDKLEDKSVWFVRLDFDYADLGQLQITAELMDKALDCQLLASSQEVTSLAHPHLDNLRSKLAKHGLQVGDLKLKQGDASHQAFYKSHAIINIKV